MVVSLRGDSGVSGGGEDVERLSRSGTDRRTELSVLGHDRDHVRAGLRRGLVVVAHLHSALGGLGGVRERTSAGVP